VSSSLNGRAARPSREDLEAARNRTLKDILAPDLAVLFCGINPGLYSAAIGHHFGRPGNRFWPALHGAGITPRIYRPEESQRLLEHRCGLTDIVERATARADELDRDELVAGRARLMRKLEQFQPRFLAVLGIGAYRTAFAQPKAQLGLQVMTLGVTRVWVLPNPSGLNAAHQVKDLSAAMGSLYLAASEAA
jgi:double-stranded uracil-DNA glycosylase